MNYFSAFLSASLLLLAACGGNTDLAAPPVAEPEPEPSPFTVQLVGLDGRIVEQLQISDTHLYALTDAGLYRAELSDLSWQLLGFADATILSLARFTDHHMLAGVRQLDQDDQPEFAFYESTDAGQSWLQISHNYGSFDTAAKFRAEPAFGLLFDASAATLYATGYDVAARSTDYGLSWQVLHGDWDKLSQPNSAIAVNPESTELWSGGQGSIENPLLYQYQLHSGELHEHHEAIHQILTTGTEGLAPAVVYSIRFDAAQPSRLYVSGEGGIAVSDDAGASWRSLLGDVDFRFYYDLLQDPTSERLFTAGWDKEFDLPQPLIIEWSDDHGHNWQGFQYPATDLFGGVRSMVLHQQQDELTLFFGLYKGGVVQVQPAL